MKRAHFNLLLLAVVIAISAGLWLTREKPETFPPLTDIARDQVHHIELIHPGTATIALSKTGDDWQLTAPITAPADPFEVASLINIATLDVRRSSGDVRIELSTAPTAAWLEAGSGNLDLTLPAGAYDLVTTTASGDIRVSGVIDEGSAERTLDLHTRSGDIRVVGR